MGFSRISALLGLTAAALRHGNGIENPTVSMVKQQATARCDGIDGCILGYRLTATQYTIPLLHRLLRREGALPSEAGVHGKIPHTMALV